MHLFNSNCTSNNMPDNEMGRNTFLAFEKKFLTKETFLYINN